MKEKSYEALLERIEALEKINDQLLKDQMEDVKLSYNWAGSLGHWYWDYQTNKVTYNPLKVTALGYELSEIKEEVNYQFFTEKLHPEDYDMVMDNMLMHLKGLTPAYEVEYRIRTKSGEYKWYYDRGVVTSRSKDGKPLFLTGIVFDISEKKRVQEELEEKNKLLREQSSRDSLTQLYNHRTLYEKLQYMMDHIKQYEPLIVAMIDIDDFKLINDQKGHVYGDQILVELARIMKDHTKKDDLVARYGGEEFLIAFPKSALQDAKNILNDIRIDFEKLGQSYKQKLTISVGVVPFEGFSARETIHQADIKLYQAKHEGKNKIISS
ncbi:MAG: hypothetical protein CVV61_06325 [Tenericutes bacterium HGW-Tenericutes-6]|nr:MAG: hypothetical protein CVV61_06325 [Tenericutes bacterium HGW-Tenericutes-6]